MPPTPPKKLTIDQLNDTYRIDDRWTESKLIAAGYEYHGEGKCRTCPDQVVFYKKERGYNQRPHWQILEEGSLAVHDCGGK